MIKRVLLFFCICFINFSSFSQVERQISFMHYGGCGYIRSFKNVPNHIDSSLGREGVFVSYAPHMNFLEIGDYASLSIGTNLIAMIPTDDYFVFDLPMFLEYNIGSSSTPDNEYDYGGFFGLGYTRNIRALDYKSTISHGFIATVGVGIPQFAFRLSFMKDFSLNKTNILSITYNFKIQKRNK